MALQAESFLGKWTYRSLHDNPDVDVEFNALRFGAGIISIDRIAYDQILDGNLDMGGGYELLITGELIRVEGNIVRLRWTGSGVPKTPTEAWVYDYSGFPTYRWQSADEQAEVIVGTVLRTVAHGSSPAGYAASFYMVKHSD